MTFTQWRAYWAWKIRPPYVPWYGSAWYWDSRWARFSYWFPVYQAGPRSGEIRGIGFVLRLGRWKKSVMVIT